MASPNVMWTRGDVSYLQIDSPKYGTWICQVDTSMLDLVAGHRWNVSTWKGKPNYAATVIHTDGARKRYSMQTYLFPDCPKGLVRDHINGDGFDNRSDNVRFVKQAHNALNRKHRLRKPGVVKIKNRDLYRAHFTVGYFRTEEEAHQAWKDAYVKVNGKLPECVA